MTTRATIVYADFHGAPMTFRENGWFNATTAAAKYGKRPHEWLRLPETQAYLDAVSRRYGEIPYVHASRARADRGGGTWLHPKLAVVFARWLNVDFGVWCDEQIDEILRSGTAKAVGTWRELMELEVEDRSSFVSGQFGSHLMLGRRAALRRIRPRRAELQRRIQPQLPFPGGAA